MVGIAVVSSSRCDSSLRVIAVTVAVVIVEAEAFVVLVLRVVLSQ